MAFSCGGDEDDCSCDDDGTDDDDDMTNDDDSMDDDDDDDDSIGHSVWTDPDSGLMWQKEYYPKNKNWYDAWAYCDLNYHHGFFDWRMPTISELRSLIRGCPDTETGGSCGITDECTSYDACYDESCKSCELAETCYWPDDLGEDCGSFWSASIDNDIPSLPFGWVVSFRQGDIIEFATGEYPEYPNFHKEFIRCVRTAD